VTRFFVFAFVAALLITPSFWAEAEVSSADVDRHKAELTAQLAQLENEIAQQTTILQDKQKERVSLERDVAILDAQIEKAKLSIKARDLSIQTLTSDIGDKANTIVALDDKLGRERQSLAAIFRKTNEIDDSTVMEFLL
jgi:septal ring factor EnvC (AmiA/AmiB activator)